MGFEKRCFSWALLVIRQSSRNWWFYSEAVCGLGLLKTLEMYLTQGLYFCMCFFLSTVLNLSWWFSLILKTILRARSIIIPFRWGNWGLGRSRNLSKVNKWLNQDLITDNPSTWNLCSYTILSAWFCSISVYLFLDFLWNHHTLPL